MKALLSKLLAIQVAVDHIAKGEKGYNYSYAGQEQVLNTIRPLMNKHKLLLVQSITGVENTRIDYKNAKGYEKSEILSSVSQEFTWMDTEGEGTLIVPFHGNGMNDWEKGLGSALTYAERYFLLKFFHIPTPNDDPDARQTPEPMTEDSQLVQTVLDEIESCKSLEELERFYLAFNDQEKRDYKQIINTKKEKLS